MKALYTFSFILFFSFAAFAQPEMGLSIYVPELGFNYPLADGGTQASPFPVPQGTVRTFTFTISNTGSSALTLTETAGDYVSLSGNAAGEIILDESNITGTVAAGGSVTFTLSSKATTPAGDYSISLSIANDDANENPYNGTITFTVSAPTSVVSAEEAGISISPNPSADGRIQISGNVLIEKVVVYGLNGTSEEFAGATSFHTRQKGMLVVHVYTNKGIVAEKISVQ
ncbi:MAG: hypothetical protein K0R51_2741 [Cytophagaceae bacterium]|jgi:hypothetical protein|nr:hypothetical protein [Cytophagaceae bacterium]